MIAWLLRWWERKRNPPRPVDGTEITGYFGVVGMSGTGRPDYGVRRVQYTCRCADCTAEIEERGRRLAAAFERSTVLDSIDPETTTMTVEDLERLYRDEFDQETP